jgi:hypothetical protein
MTAIEVKVLESKSAAEHQEQLQELLRRGWGLVWTQVTLADAGLSLIYSSILKFDHGRHFELSSVRDQVTALQSRVAVLEQWREQAGGFGDPDSTQLINPFRS